MDTVSEWATSIYRAVLEWLTHNGVTIVCIIIIATVLYYLGAMVVASIVRKLVVGVHHRTWHRRDIEKRQDTLSSLITSIWRIIVVLGALLAIILNVFQNINLAPLFASAGIIGVALGFGAQSLIKDFLSGIFIISENQYRVGDVVEVDGASGAVERIGTRSTMLRDADGNVHYIPNGAISHVINKTMGYSVARFTIAVAPASDLDKVIELIDTTGEALSHEASWKHKVLEPPHFVSIGEFTASSVEILISGRVMPSDQWSVIAEMRRRLLEEFEHGDIDLATTVPPKK